MGQYESLERFMGVGAMPTTAQHRLILQFQQRLPVDVTGLAKALGIAVWESDKLAPQISGMLFRDQHFGGSSGYSISVRKQDAYVRKRFTIAHEIAHFLLHRKELQEMGDTIADDQFYRGGLSSKQETEANQLAADILMPINLIQEAIDSGTTDVTALAKAFGVSPNAMMIRLGIPIP